ncbi:MAG: hypothetical protein WCS28_12720 [Thiomicrospira sp.]|jgi:hypothetical protein
MHYFSARQLIIDQLKLELASAGVTCRVQAAAGWKQALDNLQPAPVIFVWHQADKVHGGQTASRNNGKRQIVDQLWSVVPCVRNVGDIAGSAAQDDADALIAVVQQLQGVKLDADHGHLFRVQSQYMSAYVGGFGVYPFAFTTRIYT